MFDSRLRRLAGRNRAVVNHGRRDAARANAPSRQERELFVGSRFPGLDLRILLYRGQDLVCTLHITGRPHTNHAGVVALGLEREEVVKGGHPVDAAGGELQAVRDKQQQVVFQVTEQLLRLVQHLNHAQSRVAWFE